MDQCRLWLPSSVCSSADYRSICVRNAWLRSRTATGWWIVSSLWMWVLHDKARSMCWSVAAWKSCQHSQHRGEKQTEGCNDWELLSMSLIWNQIRVNKVWCLWNEVWNSFQSLRSDVKLLKRSLTVLFLCVCLNKLNKQTFVSYLADPARSDRISFCLTALLCWAVIETIGNVGVEKIMSEPVFSDDELVSLMWEQ